MYKMPQIKEMEPLKDIKLPNHVEIDPDDELNMMKNSEILKEFLGHAYASKQ